MDRKTRFKAILQKEIDSSRIEVYEKIKNLQQEWQDLVLNLEKIDLLEAHLNALNESSEPKPEKALAFVQINKKFI